MGVKTGIKKLDSLTGGISEYLTLIIGGVGVGKTSLALELIKSFGANKDARIYYISTKETERMLKQKANGIGVDLEKLVKEGKLKITVKSPVDMRKLLDGGNIYDEVSEQEYNLLIIDSFGLVLYESGDITTSVFRKLYEIEEDLECPVVIVSEDFDEKIKNLTTLMSPFVIEVEKGKLKLLKTEGSVKKTELGFEITEKGVNIK